MSTGATCIDAIGEARCTGCFGCHSACARSAIALTLNADGFYVPVVDRDKCNECGRCLDRCPALRVDGAGRDGCADPVAFAVWTRDEATREASSSGGAFSALAGQVIDRGGAVAGCVWGDEWHPEHRLSRSWDEVKRMRGSKYVPSRLGDMYEQVAAEVRHGGAPVLFSGTPCQVAAMDLALDRQQRARVVLVDVICHGVPSLRVFQRYLGGLFGGERVVSFTFRNKALSWITIAAVSETGRQYMMELSADSFGRGFVTEHLYQMEACYRCVFARLPRRADITLGDFWGCPGKWQDRRGVSAVVANTPSGLRALRGAYEAGTIELEPTEIATVAAGNPRLGGGPYPVPRARRAFLNEVAVGMQFEHLTKKYYPGKWGLAWRAFRNSKSKTRFVVDLARRKFARRELKANG